MEPSRFKRRLADLTLDYLKAHKETDANDNVGSRLYIGLWLSLLPPHMEDDNHVRLWALRVRQHAQQCLRHTFVSDSLFRVLRSIIGLCSDMMDIYPSAADTVCVQQMGRQSDRRPLCLCGYCRYEHSITGE